MKEYKLKINGNDYNVVINEVEGQEAKVEVNGAEFTVQYEKPISKAKTVKPIIHPSAAPAASVAKPTTNNTAPAGGDTVVSPLPGVILSVNVKEGDSVKKGQSVAVLEAMKMENAIEATVDGTITSIKVNQGDSILEGEPIVTIG